MRPRPAGAADVETTSSTVFVDPRLAVSEEPKLHKQRRAEGEVGTVWWLVRVGGLVLICYLVGVQQCAFAALTTVHCSPATVRAGTNITCEIVTSPHASESGLRLTQLGVAGSPALTDDTAHSYRVSLATSLAGGGGVRVSHLLFWSTSVVEVLAGQPVSVVVSCAPPIVAVGAEVQCAVEPRDRFGNVAEVERPPSGASNFFTVARLGSARELVVHDTYVSFVPIEVGVAGVAVTLDGQRVESRVSVR